MRVAYIEGFSGIGGDMLLGALLDAGISKELLQRSVADLKIGAELRIRRVDRSGILATKIDVLVNGRDAVDHSDHDEEHAPKHDAPHSHSHQHDDAHTHTSNSPAQTMSEKPESTADHHTHSHKHQHGRSLSEIKKMIQAADVSKRARETAIRAFE